MTDKPDKGDILLSALEEYVDRAEEGPVRDAIIQILDSYDFLLKQATKEYDDFRLAFLESCRKEALEKQATGLKKTYSNTTGRFRDLSN